MVTNRASRAGSVARDVNWAASPWPVRTVASGASNARAICPVEPETCRTMWPALSAPTRSPKPEK